VKRTQTLAGNWRLIPELCEWTGLHRWSSYWALLHRQPDRADEARSRVYIIRPITLPDSQARLIQEKRKRRLNSGSACYHSLQNLVSARLMSRNVIVRIFKTIILPAVLYRCETWSLT
jgi:hypothetical protein